MRSSEIVARELAELIQRHYYSEDFELLSAVRAYNEGLGAAEREMLKTEILRRLQTDGTLIEALLCGVIRDPAAVPALVDMLDHEPRTSQLTRALILALRNYTDVDAYLAVERFLDSDQERDALRALAAMDFARALPQIELRLRKDSYLETCLHILHDRKTKVGLQVFVEEMRACVSAKPESFRERLFLAITSKVQDYNPFTQEEIGIVLKALQQK